MFVILLIGFVLGYIIYELFKVRAGGVIAIPLLVLYTLHNIYFFFAILLTSLAVFLILEFIFKKTAIYGRRLLYVSFILSIVVTTLVMILMGETSSAFVTIIPGLIGYNFHRENNSSQNIWKALAITDTYAILVIIIALLLI